MSHQPPPLDYRTPPPKSSRRNLWSLFCAVLLVALVLIGLMPISHNRSREPGERWACASNMHQIGLAILQYQDEFGGAYPPSVEALLNDTPITPAVFICPSSNDTAGQGATTQAVIADMRKPGHLSFTYIGQGLTDKTVTDDMVVLYEPMANHAGNGMHILFGDGHAEWFNATVGKQVIAAAATGRRVHMSSAGVITITPIITNLPTTAVSPATPFRPR